MNRPPDRSGKYDGFDIIARLLIFVVFASLIFAVWRAGRDYQKHVDATQRPTVTTEAPRALP